MISQIMAIVQAIQIIFKLWGGAKEFLKYIEKANRRRNLEKHIKANKMLEQSKETEDLDESARLKKEALDLIVDSLD